MAVKLKLRGDDKPRRAVQHVPRGGQWGYEFDALRQRIRDVGSNRRHIDHPIRQGEQHVRVPIDNGVRYYPNIETQQMKRT